MAVCNTSRNSSSAIRTRSVTERRTWTNCLRTRLWAASEKKGGRKKASETQPALVPAVTALIERDTAGSPVDENIRWTNRSPGHLAEELGRQGFKIGVGALRRILFEELSLSRRQAYKDESARNYPHRDEQFQYIAKLRAKYEKHGWPVLSIDTKKKEILGNFFHPGRALTHGTNQGAGP